MERKYWAHTVSNLIPTEASNELDKGLFNIFPLDLSSLDTKANAASNLGREEGGRVKVKVVVGDHMTHHYN
jgi:hypothetical protein